MQLRRLTNRASLLALASICFLAMPTLSAQTRVVCGSKEYLNSLPVKPPKDPNTKRQIQLVNCSDQVLLGATNAAHEAGQPPWPVYPQERTWVMQPFNPNDPTNYSNVLTIDIPQEWYGQFKKGGVAPNFWARTGCRYDAVTNRAECETGGCGSQYDCSSADIGPPPATSIVEWTFYQQFQQYFFDSPDISAVNGTNLTIDVSPKGGDETDPLNPKDWHWLNWNYPLTVHNADLREPGNCQAGNLNAGNFKVSRSDIAKTNSNLPGYPLLGYVIVDGNGNPTMPAGNNVLGCLSNCAKYKFPLELGYDGCNAKTNPDCYFWKTFCAGSLDINYGDKCNTGIGDGHQCETDADCLKCNPGTDFHIACFKKAGPNKPGTCELRAFFKGTVSQCNGMPDPQFAAPTSKIACTNTYGSINPLDNDEQTRYDYADQPIVGTCDSVVFSGTGQKAACVGDDTLHKILHGAYTWPNDPQVYQGDASVYRIVFSPEGRGNAPITAAEPVPACDDLPANYKPAANRGNCSIPIMGQNSFFGIGLVRNQQPDQWQSNGHDWPCFIAQRGDPNNGILCYWTPPPANYTCLAPKTDSTYVTNSACGRIESGTSLVSGSMTPNNNDPLFVEVSIPKVLNTVSLPTSVSGCAGSWTLIASQAVHSNQGVVAWYRGVSTTSAACQVTVTMASENPAEVKVYDVPKFNGTVETMSTASGDYTQGPEPTVSAGVATTRNNDLQLGALLMVDQRPTPITYWKTWLSNGPTNIDCLAGNTNCPRDDGTDFLPGHGPYSANSDVGHNFVMAGAQYFHRDANAVLNQSNFSWVGLAIYVELNQ